MNDAIQRAIGIPDEASFADRTIRRDESGDDVSGAVERRQRHLRIGNRVQAAARARAAAADSRLRVAHAAAIAIERRPQADALFSRYATVNGIQLHEVIKRAVEQTLFVSVQTGKRATGSGAVAAGPRILLSLKRASNRNKDREKTETTE